MRYLLLIALTVYTLVASPIAEYNLYRANTLYREGHYKQAIEIYEAIEPKDDRVYFNIANSYYRLGKYQKAIEYYKLIEDESFNAKKLYNIANAYVMQKNYLKAIIFYRNALKFSDNPKYKENLEYAKRRIVVMRDVMLSNAKCSATLAVLDNFDDQNVSKDLQDAKYLNESKFNVVNEFKPTIEDLIEKYSEGNETNRSKEPHIEQKLIDKRVDERLKERSNKVLLIPVEEKR